MKRLSTPAACALGLAAVFLVLAVARAQGLRLGKGPEPLEAVRLYEGTSPRGELQEALNAAVGQALRSLPGADRMVRYRVREITGEQGGIAGVNTLRVVIEVPQEGLQNPNPAADEGAAALRPELRLSRPRVRRGGDVGLLLTARNALAHPRSLEFTSGQKYDFEAWRDDRLVWRWSHGRNFTQALVTLHVQPNETLSYNQTWNLRDNDDQPVPAGDYLIRGYLTHQGQRVVATQRLTVE